jgi:hypothetical protein
MLLITEEAVIICDHQPGEIQNQPSQTWVTVEGVPILVATDPEGREIKSCPNTNPLTGQVKCSTTLKVQRGYSELSRIDGHAICLDSLVGLTDGAPPGLYRYSVRTPGQDLVGLSE